MSPGTARNAEFSITTDAVQTGLNVAPELAAFAAAGFRAVHWCQNWASEPVFYGAAYAEQVRQLVAHNGLRVADVHGYCGLGSDVSCTDELFLAANINRAEFARRLGADVLVVHLPVRACAGPAETLAHCRAVLEALRAPCRRLGVRVALENGTAADEVLGELLVRFEPEDLGWCYDSGHAVLHGREDFLHRYGDRLLALHLHDNDGSADQHRLPGQGKVNWARVLPAIAASPYGGPINLEVAKPRDMGLEEFCRLAHATIRELWRRHVGG